MLYIETNSKDAAFYFSAEEYLMRHFEPDVPIMMIWQTEKCVMLGNYQVADAEVNISYARKEEMQLVRRPSGGGTIFTDSGTVLYTLILPSADRQYATEAARKEFADSLTGALNSMGIPAKFEGRNDIVVDGKKVSGIAQHAKNSRLCTHGSILYNTDLDMLAQVLNVDAAKIQSKAIRSVRSRVTNIKEYMGQPFSTFLSLLKRNLLEDRNIQNYSLADNELRKVEEIYHEKYGNPAWTFEKSPRFSFHNSIRFTEGKVEVYLDIVEGSVASCSIRGDFLGTVPIRGLEEQLEKITFQYQTMHDALDRITLAPYLGGITKDQLLSCMFN